jgi:hypothetical protein
MEIAVFQSESKSDIDLLLTLARKMGINSKKLTSEEIEDIGLANAIKIGATNEYIDVDEFINSLSNEVKN